MVLTNMADFDLAEIEGLMAAALQLADVHPEAGVTGPVILKAEAHKQRGSRGGKAAAYPAGPQRAK